MAKKMPVTQTKKPTKTQTSPDAKKDSSGNTQYGDHQRSKLPNPSGVPFPQTVK